jgi:hypothetical protein
MTPEPERILLLDHLRRAFPERIESGEVDAMFARAWWNHILGCWLTTAWGMVLGIELDGSVHS